jgi:cytochrome c-type biogenesis protein CcmH
MNATLGFLVAATLVVVVVLAIVLPPLWRKGGKKAVEKRENNVDVYRDQLDELERDRAQGALTGADFEEAKAELQRRLLEETSLAAAPSPASSERTGGRKTAYALILAVPLAALAGYMMLGAPQALDAPPPAQAHARNQQMDEMLAKLEQRLKDNPNDAKGWAILARSYKALDRYDEAARAFAKASALVNDDATLLADYAEVLAAKNGDSFEGKPDELIKRALAIDPDDMLALFLAGSSARDRNDFVATVQYWERLLPKLTPGSQDAKNIGDAVAQARQIVAKNGGTVPPLAAASPAPAAAKAKPQPAAAASSAEAISGEVSLSDKVKAQAGAGELLFIFARPAEGSRMPLAVMRSEASALPLKFRLDDTMSLPGGQKLSEFKSVTIEARIAKAGMAQTSSGDLFGKLEGVKPGSKSVKLVIDQVQP